MRLAAVPPVDHKRLLKEPLPHIPAGAKLLRSEANRGQEGIKVTCVFGILHSCQQFVQASRSRSLSHLFDEFMNVPDILLQCMFDILTMGPIAISKMRLQKLQAWRKIRLELEGAEKAMHASWSVVP